MWWDIIGDDALLHLAAKHWISPITAGYLPPKYRDHLAGERMMALSKQGIRPINVTDAWRQITAKDYCRLVCANTNSFFSKVIRECFNLPRQHQMEPPSCSTSQRAS